MKFKTTVRLRKYNRSFGRNLLTGEELQFDSLTEAKRFINRTNRRDGGQVLIQFDGSNYSAHYAGGQWVSGKMNSMRDFEADEAQPHPNSRS